MKILSTLLVLFFITTSNAQDTINQLDSIGKKTGYWRITGEMRNLPDYKKDALIEEGYYKRNRKIGTWKKYWPNGNLKSELEFKNGRVSGEFTTYDEAGKIEDKGDWSNQNQNNSRWSYSCGSYLEYEFKTSNSKTFYYPKDTLKQKKVSLIPKPPLQEEAINGYNKIFNEDDDILLDGEFKKGVLIEGNHYIYDEYGLLSFINQYREGKYISRGTIAAKK